MNPLFYLFCWPWLVAILIMEKDWDSPLRFLMALPFIGLGFLFLGAFTIAASALVMWMIMFPFWALGYLEIF